MALACVYLCKRVFCALGESCILVAIVMEYCVDFAGIFLPAAYKFFSDANMINEHPSCMYDRSFHFGFGVSLGSL
jgi:hypothetical protein